MSKKRTPCSGHGCLSPSPLLLTQVRISKWLAELEQRFFGAALSYDKALAITDMVESKEAMTEALWKNVYNAEGDKTAASMLQR